MAPDEGRGDWGTGHLSWSSSKSVLAQDIWKSLTNGHGANAGVLQHVTTAFGMHKTGTANLENPCRNEQGPGFVNCFIKAQTVASNQQRNLTHGVVESDTRKQPEMEMRKVKHNFHANISTEPATCRLNALHTSVPIHLVYICCTFNLQIYSKLDTSKRQWIF